MVFLHAPFVLFRYGFFYVMLISDIRKQNLVCIFLHPHRSAEFRPLEETVCGKQSAYCSAILHPHSMINLSLFFLSVCAFSFCLFHTFMQIFSILSNRKTISKSQRVTRVFFFFSRQGGIWQETNAEVTLLSAITRECLLGNQWTLDM